MASSLIGLASRGRLTVREINLPGTHSLAKNLWGRAVFAGAVAEAGVFAVMPAALRFGERVPLFVIPPVCFVITCFFGYLVARKAAGHRILHGTVVGTVAALIYISITLGLPLPFAYILSHFLKVFGGVVGGYLGERSARQPAIAT
jgi:hypothetical protein